MDTRQDGFKVMKPILYSLSHYASVKIAVLLFEAFGFEELKDAFVEIQSSTMSKRNVTENHSRPKKIQLRKSPRIKKANLTTPHGSRTKRRNGSKKIQHPISIRIQKENSIASGRRTAVEKRKLIRKISIHKRAKTQFNTPPQIQDGNSTTSEGSKTERDNSSKRIQLDKSQIQYWNSSASEGSRGESRKRTKRIQFHPSPKIQHKKSSPSEGNTTQNLNNARKIQLHTSQIPLRNSTPSVEDTVKIRNTAKEILLHIPSHLIQTVMNAVYGSEHAVKYWKWYNSNIFQFNEEGYRIYWSSVGSIDENETARHLVGNHKFDRIKRFKIACVYCLEESVKDLWAEMEESGEVEIFGPGNLENGIVDFWVKRMRARSLVPWTQSLTQCLGTFILFHPPLNGFNITLVPRCSVFFPVLGPEERHKFFHLVGYSTFNDLRLCLYTVTRTEEEQLLKMWAPRCLRVLLEWPLQTLFLETAEKLWSYITGGSFCDLLVIILRLKKHWLDFNYSDIFDRFWNKSPGHLKESAKNCPYTGPIINLYFDGKKKETEIMC